MTTRGEVAGAVEARAAVRSAPALIDFQVEQEDSVYPMVPAGADLHTMIRAAVADRGDERRES